MNRDQQGHIDLLVVSYAFDPVWSGAAERFVRYGPMLRDRGVRMSVATAMQPGQNRRAVRNGMKVQRLGKVAKGSPSVDRFMALVAFHVLRRQPRPHVVCFLTVGRFLLPILWLFRLLGHKLVYVHTMARLQAGVPRSVRLRILNRLKGLVYRSFHSIVCSTPAFQEDMTVLGVNPSNIRVIPNGVSLSRFRPPTDTEEVRLTRTRLGLDTTGNLILFVGRRSERKGVIELIEAWKRYRRSGGDGWLLLVGEDAVREQSSNDFLKRWDACVAGLRPEDHVELRDPDQRIEDYFRVADLFVFLSHREGTPNVVLEAMASGVPVLTTTFRGFSLGTHGKELLTTVREPVAVSEALAQLLGDPERRRQLSTAARRWVETHQDVEVSIERYRALIDELVAR